MAAVVVTIAGRTYRMSCEDGEEPRLEQLARYVEGKILSMREGFGEIGDQRIVVMAALAIADEATDARGRAQAMEMDIAALRAELDAARKASAAMEARVAGALEDATRRLERLNADLQKSAAPRDEFP
ncbi:cell division protein ZapA [Methylocystis sp. WRRC1]|uniref:cell division protein ZapA n=1 Tax=Methylocystis sp. WRRC1 TaxID=1732014 RepID=UPI001D1533AE|nr:cell division protein ZapA [Methylocystis sp. WRRC1]MCC3245495.1 cell division protein ZapA [Methylocystis sp. WRRC1]